MSDRSALQASWQGLQDDLDRRPASALGLAGFCYTSPEFYERERATIFKSGWIAVAMAVEIANAGDVLVREAAGWRLLLTRDSAGEIRCFHNICRHRGMAVATSSCSKQRALHCPWHGWTYDLDGRLRSTPEFAGPCENDVGALDRTQHGLVPVRVARWFDFLFINLDGHAPPLEQFLAPLRTRLAAYDDFSMFQHAHSWHHVYEGNWKIAVEGAIEDYHLPCVHPQITRGRTRAQRSGVEIGAECYFMVSSQSSSLAQGRTPDNVPRLPQVPGLQGADACSTYFLNIFPTGVLGIAPDGLYAGVWLPDGPDRTRLDFHFYFVGEEGARGARYETSRTRWIDLITGVFEQDSYIVKTVHQTARLRDEVGVRTRFSPFWELAVHHFQQRVLQLVADPS